MKAVIAKSRWLYDEGCRLDASFHSSDGRFVARKIQESKLPMRSLHTVTRKIFNGPRFARCYVNDKQRGLPFLSSSDIIRTNLSNLKLLSKKHTKNLNNLLVSEGWILISCSGTIGNMAYCRQDMDNLSATQHVMRIVPNEKVLPGYLYAFLFSRYGKSMVVQGTYGAVIQHIEPQHIREIPIPFINDKKMIKIDQLIREASTQRCNANELMQKSINALIDTTTINQLNKSELTFKVKAHEILASNDKFTNELRLEVDYYLPSRKQIEKTIENSNSFSTLGDSCIKIKRSGLRERKFVKNGIPLVTGQNLNMIRLDDLKHLSKKYTKNIEDNITHTGDILVSCQGTIGKTEYVYKNIYENVFASEQLIKITVDKNKIHPGFVYLFLSSPLGQEQLLKYKTGSVIEWIRENHVASIRIPIPNDNGFELGEKANLICEKRQQALEIENEAISMINQELSKWLD